MREYEVKKEIHNVYDAIDEVPTSIQYMLDWRKASVGDWVVADDGCVIQILRGGKMMKHKKKVSYVGTCTGTFICSKSQLMDTSKRKNIYSFGGNNNHLDSVQKRKNLTAQEAMFSKYIALGLNPQEAYKKSFSTDNNQYAKIRSGILIKQERIVSAVKEELDKVFKDLGIDLTYLVDGVKSEADNPEGRPIDRLKAFQMLWDAAEVVPKQKVTQVTGSVFQGFDSKEIASAIRPELPAHEE